MHYYDITSDLTFEQCVALLEFYESRLKEVMFTVTSRDCVTEECSMFLDRLISLGAKKEVVTEFPGTKLYFGHTADLYTVSWSTELSDMILDSGKSMFSWRSPDSPEDLCLVDKDDLPVLISTAHESYALILLSDADAVAWSKHDILSDVFSRMGKYDIPVVTVDKIIKIFPQGL